MPISSQSYKLAAQQINDASTLLSVSKARRILGSFASKLSDDQVRELIICLHLLAKDQLVYNGSKDE